MNEKNTDAGPVIEPLADGPLKVTGLQRFRNSRGEAIAAKRTMALCRCGASKNKPFCDGTHVAIGFTDAKSDERVPDKLERYDGGEVSILDNRGICSHAGHCTAGLPAVWRTSTEPWIDADGAEREAIVGIIRRCPSGALSYLEGEAAQTAYADTPEIEISRDGPYLVRTDAGFSALDGRCPHQGGPLGEGTICDGNLRCPWHGYDFDLATGRGVGNDDAVDVLKVREDDGRIEIAAPAPARSNWTVSHVIAETMVDWGVDAVFGMVGHSNLGMAEALRVQGERGRLRYFGVRHEGAAAFACSGYAKVSGRPAACLSIAGPGATNLLTGLWDAKVDRAPVLALTGQVNTQVMGPGAFQDIDLSSAFEAVTRFSQTVLPGSDHAELTSLALKTALVERDVAHLILPDEVQVLDAGREGPGRPDGRTGPTEITPPPAAVDLALARIARAVQPLIIVGYGAREGMAEVTALAEALGCPVITTFKAKGQIGDDHPLGGGVLGRSGTPVASSLMNEADLLIVFGASFSHHTGIDARKPIIQVDFDRMALGKFHAVDEAVWGDIATTAALLRERLPAARACRDQRGALAELWQSWRAEKQAREGRDDGDGVNSAIIFRHLAEAVPDDAVLSVDVGNNTYSFGRYFECTRQSVLMSGYLGSIGFGFPAAMGAWAAVGDERKVVSISGDGGFAQYMGEFTTAVKYGMNITHVLLNNAELGKISKEQRDGAWQVWQTSLQNPGFAAYAELCGGLGIRVESADALPEALATAMAADGPALVEVMADPMLT